MKSDDDFDKDHEELLCKIERLEIVVEKLREAVASSVREHDIYEYEIDHLKAKAWENNRNRAVVRDRTQTDE